LTVDTIISFTYIKDCSEMLPFLSYVDIIN